MNQPTEAAMIASLIAPSRTRNRVSAYTRITPSTGSAARRNAAVQTMKIGTLAR